MKYLLAVSGGIDSVVLLDMLARKKQQDLIVAHFDHGIREDSAADARFVEALAQKYDLPFVTKREELGVAPSEELARARRYHFLRQMAKQHNATIVTAHHGDDVIETIAINLHRGTGWRGLAVLDSADITRPLLTIPKSTLRAYALEHRLEWVEDSTNAQDIYLRNRVRRLTSVNLPSEVRQSLHKLWQQQIKVKTEINTELVGFLQQSGEYERYFFITIDALTACEILRAIIKAAYGTTPTRPQTERALLAIKTASANTQYDVGSGCKLRFTLRTFIVETP